MVEEVNVWLQAIEKLGFPVVSSLLLFILFISYMKSVRKENERLNATMQNLSSIIIQTLQAYTALQSDQKETAERITANILKKHDEKKET
jgi:hypothetical protein